MDQSYSDLDSEFWVSEDGSDYDDDDDDDGFAPYKPRAEDATGFMLELTPEGEAGDFHTRGKRGQVQRSVATEYYGGRKKRPAYNVGAEAKAIIHGKLDKTSMTRATLLVYDFKFLSHRATRIKDASISFEFQAKKGSTSLGPTVAAVAPYLKHTMVRTTETVATTLSGDAGIQDGTIVTGNAGVHGERSVQKTVTHAAQVVGDNPADEWGNRFLAQWSLSENKSQGDGIEGGIVSLFRACILLTRENDEDFYLHPTVKVTPDTATQLTTPLSGFRRADDSIKFVPSTPAVNKLEGDVSISSSELGSGLGHLWDCTFYSSFEDAIKESKPKVTREGLVEKVTTAKETNSEAA